MMYGKYELITPDKLMNGFGCKSHQHKFYGGDVLQDDSTGTMLAES